jgi:hypothetical protein
MQIVARGEFQPSASSIALQSTSTSPRSKAGEDLGQLALRRLAGDGAGVDAASWKALATFLACCTPAV